MILYNDAVPEEVKVMTLTTLVEDRADPDNPAVRAIPGFACTPRWRKTRFSTTSGIQGP